MEKHEFILHPSLQQMAVIKVAINVWNEAENLNLLNQPYYDFLIFPKKVKEKVLSSALPKEIKEKLLNTLELIALQMLKWKERHTTSLHKPGNFLDKLCWTSVGTVDNRKTAKTLIKLGRIDMSSRYRLACQYCLENDISLIWEQLEDDAQEYFRERSRKDVTKYEPDGIWTHKLNHDKINLGGFCRVCKSDWKFYRCDFSNAFEAAVSSANKEAAKCFLQKSKFNEREASLGPPNTFNIWVSQCYDEDLYKKLINLSDVLVYLLSQMNEEEQVEMFKFAPLPCVISFLEWPWHVLFKKVAKISLKYFDIEDFKLVLKVLVGGRKICGYYFTELLEEFLQVSPDHFTKIIYDNEFMYWKCRFFSSYNSDCINIMLRNLKAPNKRYLVITSEEGRRHCIKLMDEEKWELLKLLFADCALSKSHKTRVKKYFKKISLYGCKDFLACHKKDRNWSKFFTLIDETGVENCSKRKLEGMEAGECSGKRLK